MAVTRIGPKHQITIPREAFERLALAPGDMLDVQIREEVLCLIPQKLVPRDQAWFWSREWQDKEREADEAIVQGELSTPFDTAEELVRHLRHR